MRRGVIITFYSWKGGVGRTMALANVALILASLGNRVLMIDWDLEAPGLRTYFEPTASEAKSTTIERATNLSGLMGLLTDYGRISPSDASSDLWKQRLSKICIVDPKNAVVIEPSNLCLLCAGYHEPNYQELLQDFSWARFFASQFGGEHLEQFREQLIDEFDFVLVDSRTGLTDSGGVCTIHMPDTLVFVFTSNVQSLGGGFDAINGMQDARRNYAYDRAPLKILPLLSRWDGKEEIDRSHQWISHISTKLTPIMSNWLPKRISGRAFFEAIKVPYVPAFSFGEPLPFLSHGATDSDLPGLYYKRIAELLSSEMDAIDEIIPPNRTLAADPSEAKFQSVAFLQKVFRASSAVARIGTINGVRGSGFLVKGSDILPELGDEKILVTSSHVLYGDISAKDSGDKDVCEELFAEFGNSGDNSLRRSRITLLFDRSYSSHDVVLLRLADSVEDVTTLVIAGGSQPEWFHTTDRKARRSRCFVISYPRVEEAQVSISEGSLRAVDVHLRHLNKEVIAYDAPTGIGASGAPVLDENLRVIGVAFGSDFAEGQSRTNIGISINQLIAELRDKTDKNFG